MPTLSFPQASLTVLADLARHNNKAWFDANRDRIDAELLSPARLIVDELCTRLASPFPYLTGGSQTSGGSLTRLHRDVRFSKDKRPFHTHLGMVFWHRDGKKMETPGFFLRISPDELLLATGLHQPDAERLGRIRRAIDADRGRWTRATRDKTFARVWGGLGGESLKRVPAPWPADHPLAEDLKRRDFTAFIRLPATAATQPDFLKTTAASWRASAPLIEFLCQAAGFEI